MKYWEFPIAFSIPIFYVYFFLNKEVRKYFGKGSIIKDKIELSVSKM